MKRGNVVATIIILSLLLVSALVITERTIFPSESSQVQRVLNEFSRTVFESPADVINLYAQDGFHNQSLWFCGDYASPPNLTKVYADFPEFAAALLEGKVDSLAEEFPDINVSMERPVLELLGATVEDDLNLEVVSVNVTDMRLTIEEGDRTVTRSFAQQQEYALRFWLMYRGLSEWLKCGNGGVFQAIDEVLEKRECAFHKSICFCNKVITAGSDDPYVHTAYCDPGEKPGIDCNPCPCGMGDSRPWQEETCESGKTKDCQDFTESDRLSLMQTYGVRESDFFSFAETIESKVNEVFMGTAACEQEVITEDTGIRCSVSITEPVFDNGFVSEYATWKSICPIWPLDGSCGIVPINVLHNVFCMDAPFCNVPGTKSSILDNPESIEQVLKTAGSWSENCREVRNEGDNNVYWQCGNGGLQVKEACDEKGKCETVLDPTQCTYQAMRFMGSQGETGHDPDFNDVLVCNERPADAASPRTNVASAALFTGDERIKNLRQDRPKNDPWLGTVGWLDRRGEFDAVVTCTDPEQPITANIDLKVHFQHGCDANQRSNLHWHPPICGFSIGGPVETQRCTKRCSHLNDGCNQFFCSFVEDEEGNPTEEMYCKQRDTEGDSCRMPGNSCERGTCQVVEEGQLECSSEETTFVGRGAACEATDVNQCTMCDGAGNCIPRAIGTSCVGSRSTGPCREYGCEEGACVQLPVPDGQAINRVGECFTGTCKDGQPDPASFEMVNGACSGATIQVSCGGATEQRPGRCEGFGESSYCEVDTSGEVNQDECCVRSAGCTDGKVCCELGDGYCFDPAVDSCDVGAA